MIKPRPLPFSINIPKDSWTLSVFHGEVRNIGEKIWRAVMKKHDFTCQRCGFVSKQFQEVSHKDGNHKNMSDDNLECLCPLCHQCEHLPLAGKSKGAEIIWFPEFSQEALNLTAIAAMIATKGPMDSPFRESGESFFRSLKSRLWTMNNHIVQDSTNPYYLAQILLKATHEEKKKMSFNLNSMRLFPKPARFLPQAEYWSKSLFKNENYHLDKWLSFIDSEKLIENIKEEKKRLSES
jgi:hypothetical protein